MAKRKKIKQYTPTQLQLDARVWCIKNNIKILPEPTFRGIFLIIDAMGNLIKSPNYYTNETVTPKIYELYEYLYKKYF